jgi:hypothetical protein
MKRLRRLCEATRAINAAASITLHGVPDRDDYWVVRVAVGDIILVETGAGLLDKVIGDAGKKLQSLSQRVLSAVTPSAGELPDAPDEDDDERESSIPPPPTPRKP